jgi:diketogulonate reductase-like aldo/keto reductase/alpha-ketoglutarate-dependent taurine dioxygenase
MYRVTNLLESPDFSDSYKIPKKTLLNAEKFVPLLSQHKALLIQNDDGEKVMNVEDFGSFVTSFDFEKYDYVGGAAPRTVIPVKAGDDVVFTANEAPRDATIPFHHELAQVANPPAYIFFFCDTAAESGGETALIDSTLVYRYVNDTFPEFMDKLKLYGARYIRTIPVEDDKSSPIGRSWKNTYNVDTKEELEAKLETIKGLDYEWKDDDAIKVTSEPVPAIKYIDELHSHMAVHQYTFHNAIIAAFTGWFDSRNDRLKSVRFGNDEVMDQIVLNSIASFMEQHKVAYKWNKGDLFALDNRLVMHSRNSYDSPRRILASMWGDVRGGLNALSKAKTHTNVQLGDLKGLPNPLRTSPAQYGFWRLDTPEESVYQAIKNGYRRLDSACDYGNEEFCGKGIKRALDEKICIREELHITSKLWNTYHKPEHVIQACQKTLLDLGVEYLDEYIIHFPISLEFVPFEDKYPPEWTNSKGDMIIVANDINLTWKAMEKLVDDGLVRTIGVSNFSTQHIRQILSIARIRPTSLQVELHPQNSQTNLIRFAREAGMRISGFSPLGGTSYDNDSLISTPLFKDLAKKYSKSPAQIILRWAIQRNTMPISKTNSVIRMKENLNLFDFYLHKNDMSAINDLNRNQRFNDPSSFCEAAFGTYMPIYE